MEFKDFYDDGDRLNVGWDNPTADKGVVYIDIIETGKTPFDVVDTHAALALSPEDAVKLAKELIRLSEGG